MGDGIEVMQAWGVHSRKHFVLSTPAYPATHIAYPADVARARDRVMNAALFQSRYPSDANAKELSLAVEAWAALDAAEGGAS